MATSILQSKTKIQRLTELGMDFIENQIELTKLSIAETTVKSSSKLLSVVIISIFSFFMIVFLSLGTAFWIGKAMGSTATGFFIVAMVYFVLMVFSLLFIKPFISNQISKSLINALDNEDENR